MPEDNEIQEQEEQETAAQPGNADDSEESGDEGEQKSEESAASEGEHEEEQPKKKGGFQRKVDKLTRRVSDTERERDYWRNAALGKSEEKAGKTEKSEEVTASQPEPEPKLKDFSDWDEYMSAQRKWMLKEAERIADTKLSAAEKRRQEQEGKQQQEAEAQRQQQEFKAREERASKKHKDWEDVAGTEDDPVVLIELQALNAQKAPGVAAIADVLGKADPDGDLEYYFASNPDEIKRIAALPPVQASLELGKLLGTKLAPPKSTAAKVENDDEDDDMAVAAVSKAPPPPKFIQKSAPTATGLSDDLSDKEWLKRRNAELRKAAQKR